MFAPRALCSPLVFACSLFASGAVASNARADHAPPPALPVLDRQAPERESDPLVRRPVELRALGTTAWLGCSGSAPRVLGVADPCAKLGAAYGVDASLLYRPFPRAALGASVVATRFAWDPSRVFEGAPSAGEARWTSLALIGRVSFVDEGRLDPWMAASAGMAFLTMEGGGDRRVTRVGFLTRASAGLDVWLTGRWKLVAQVDAAWQPGAGSERCEGGVCLDGATLARVPGRSLGAGLGLALAFGDPL